MSAKIESLIASVEKAEAAVETAKGKLNAELESVPLGTVFDISGEKMEVTRFRPDENSAYVRRLTYVFSARQRAIMRGETPPPMRERADKTELKERTAKAAQ